MFENRPLTKHEKEKLPKEELEVVRCYEYTTKRKFMRFDVPLLKQLTKVATPAQIISQIKRFHYDKRYSQNFKEFFYIVQPVQRMFGKRRGGKKQNERKQ